VGTKMDLRNDAECNRKMKEKGQQPIQEADGDRLKHQLGAYKYLECSALTQEGLKQVFDDAIRCVLESTAKPKPKRSKCTIL